MSRSVINELRGICEVQVHREVWGTFRNSLSRLNGALTSVSRELGLMRETIDLRIREMAVKKLLTPEQKDKAEAVDAEVKKLEHELAKFWFESGFEKRIRELDDAMGFAP